MKKLETASEVKAAELERLLVEQYILEKTKGSGKFPYGIDWSDTEGFKDNGLPRRRCADCRYEKYGFNEAPCVNCGRGDSYISKKAIHVLNGKMTNQNGDVIELGEGWIEIE